MDGCVCLAASVYRNIDLAAMPVKAPGNINRDCSNEVNIDLVQTCTCLID